MGSRDETTTRYATDGNRRGGVALAAQLWLDQLQPASVCPAPWPQSHRGRRSCGAQQWGGSGSEAPDGVGGRPVWSEANVPRGDQRTQPGVACLRVRRYAVGAFRNPGRAWNFQVTSGPV